MPRLESEEKPSRLARGKKEHPSRPTQVWMGSYTDEQLATLETLHDQKYALGIADAKYVNHVLTPDGKLSTDLDTVRKHIKEEVTLTSAELLSATRETRKAARAAANKAQDLQDEFEDHVEQKRFLFIVDEQGLPIVYYQTAVEGNPDLPMLKAHDTPEHRAKMEALVEEHAAGDRKLRAEAAKKAAKHTEG